MTRRLYYDNSYLTSFEAAVTDTGDGRRKLFLDQTAFYPTSGGQPFDLGTINGIPVVEIVEDDGRIAHLLAEPVVSETVHGVIDWSRRFDHMQQHTGQHLLSAVLAEEHGIQTVSFHLGQESATIDVNVASLDASLIRRVEQRVNELVFENRPVAVQYEDATQAEGLRKASGREGTLRIVSIEGLDRSACGGTHVRATGEIGPVLLRKLDKIRGNVRIEFLAGARAIRRARADYDTLNQVAQSFSAPIDDTPALVAAQIEKVADLAKNNRKLATDLAQFQGRELYQSTPLSGDGIRRHLQRIVLGGSIGEEIRTMAQSFTSLPKAVYLALAVDPPSILLACSADSGMHAGNLLKPLLQVAGGRGGGNAQLAQGSVPSADALETIVKELSYLPG